jgi:hypothetical protein
MEDKGHGELIPTSAQEVRAFPHADTAFAINMLQDDRMGEAGITGDFSPSRKYSSRRTNTTILFI